MQHCGHTIQCNALGGNQWQGHQLLSLVFVADVLYGLVAVVDVLCKRSGFIVMLANVAYHGAVIGNSITQIGIW